MAQIAVGRELPNLKITLGNDFKPDEVPEEGELSDDENPIIEADEITDSEKTVEIHRKFISPLETFRKYENIGGAFITGLDLSSETISKKLEERAARFGVEDRPKKPITQAEINALYESLEISTENSVFPSSKSKNIRLDALHMRGVEEMSTNDIFDYFKEYGPASVEWINDYSCNVVWLDEIGPARSLLGLSRVLVIQKKSQMLAEDAQKTESADNADVDMNDKAPEMEEVIVMSDSGSDEDDEEDDKLIGFKHQKNETDAPNVEKMEVEETTDPVEKKTEAEEDGRKSPVDVPVPPGHWRLGIPHGKAKAILLRFAMKDDRKLPGAEKRSHYYQKYGNPNYGGMRGLISATRKRKIMATKKKIGVQQLSNKTTPDAVIKPDDINNYLPNPKQSKKIRMRMYADDEEEKIIKKAEHHRKYAKINRDTDDTSNKNIHDRLGKSDNQFNHENFRIHVIPSNENKVNRNVHERVRRSNREIDRKGHFDVKRSIGSKPKRNVHDRLGRNEHGRDRRDFQITPMLSSEEEDDYSSVRSAVTKPGDKKTLPSRYDVWTHLAENMARESDEQDSVVPSRRRKRDHHEFGSSSSSQDLRSKIHSPGSNSSSRRKSSSNSGSDLRSKLEKIRKSDKVSKHRSPLMIEVENRSSD